MSTTIIGFPRLGEFRELKFTTENTLEKKSQKKNFSSSKDLRAKHWNIVKEKASLKFHQMTFLTMITS